MPPLEYWKSIVDPAGMGMAEAIAGEIAAFASEPMELVLQKMATGKDDLKNLWAESAVDENDPDSVRAFYRDHFVEAYELAEWHCGRMNGTPPLNYARAALLCQEQGVQRVLDYGAGIGTGSIALASAGCKVESADIARKLLELVDFRMQRRGLHPHLIDLNEHEPRKHYYDAVICFDVLEHIPDQLMMLRKLETYLVSGGFLFINLFSDSRDIERPMHISSAGNRLALMRRTSCVPWWPGFSNELQVLVRRPLGRLRNYAASWIDWLQGKQCG